MAEAAVTSLAFQLETLLRPFQAYLSPDPLLAAAAAAVAASLSLLSVCPLIEEGLEGQGFSQPQIDGTSVSL